MRRKGNAESMENQILERYKTLKNTATVEYIINKSRFIVNAKRTENEQAAAAFIISIKKKYWDATHNCSAYIIGSKADQKKADDDGEPSGTAGHPMLDVLEKKKISDLTVVVSRYFGGIKLGAGGLIRAYGHGVSSVLAAAIIVERTPFEKVELEFAYTFMGSLENCLHKTDICVLQKDYADAVKFTVLIGIEESKQILDTINDLTAGSCIINNLGYVYYDVQLS